MSDIHYTQGARILELLRNIHTTNGRVSIADLAETMGESPATIKRLIRVLRTDFEVDIQYHRSPGDSPPGRYSIENWGMFNRKRVLAAHD